MRLLFGLVVLLVRYIVFTGVILAENIVINEFYLNLNPAGKVRPESFSSLEENLNLMHIH